VTGNIHSQIEQIGFSEGKTVHSQIDRLGLFPFKKEIRNIFTL